jgi:hypothetical protein
MSQECHKLQEYPKFHNDAYAFHGYAHFKTFWKIVRVFSSFSCGTAVFTGRIFVKVIVYSCSTV